MNQYWVVFLSSLFLISIEVWANEPKPESWRRGYIETIHEEREQVVEEMILIPEPPRSEVDLQQIIFNKEFSRDMLNRYERRFGYTAIEQDIDAPNRFEEVEYFNGIRVTQEEDVQRKRSFGEYMLRKLTEHHADIYFKSNKSTRKIYEAKEKISNANVSIKGGYKLKAKYSLSGQDLKLTLKNPHKMRIEFLMEMGSSGAGDILTLGGPIYNKINLVSHYNLDDTDLTIVNSRKLAEHWEGSITLGGKLKDIDDNRILFGITWRD